MLKIAAILIISLGVSHVKAVEQMEDRNTNRMLAADEISFQYLGDQISYTELALNNAPRCVLIDLEQMGRPGECIIYNMWGSPRNNGRLLEALLEERRDAGAWRRELRNSIVPSLALTALADLLLLTAGLDYATILKADLVSLFPMFLGLIHERRMDAMNAIFDEQVSVTKALQLLGVVNGVTLTALSVTDKSILLLWPMVFVMVLCTLYTPQTTAVIR